MAVPLHHFRDESGTNECRRLFVYGTLRAGFTNRYARLLTDSATLLGEARVCGRLYNLGDYPGVRLLSNGDEWVTGELYQVPEGPLFEELDEYEGPDFRRVQTTVRLKTGETTFAWVYEYAHVLREDRRILSGDFLNR